MSGDILAAGRWGRNRSAVSEPTVQGSSLRCAGVHKSFSLVNSTQFLSFTSGHLPSHRADPCNPLYTWIFYSKGIGVRSAQ